LAFISYFKSHIAKTSAIKTAYLLLTEDPALTSAFSDVLIISLFLLTAPVPLATSEISFSELKFANNCIGFEVLLAMTMKTSIFYLFILKIVIVTHNFDTVR
jgi:hypothetical protein